VKNRVYLDTNIVADILDSSRTSHKKSLALLKKLILQNYEICISEDMLSTLFYISKDKETTLEFFQNVVFVDWKVFSFGERIIKEGVKLALTEKVDLEDLLQCLCAKENECDIIITNDKRFCDCGVQIMSVEEF
jgi:predicted nucleic acid-binding protein